MKAALQRLLKLGIQEGYTEIQVARYQVLNFFCVLILLCNLVLIPLRLYAQEWLFLSVNSITVILSFISFKFVSQSKINTAVILTAGYIFIPNYILTYSGFIETTDVILILTIIPISIFFLIDKKQARFIVLLTSTFLLLFLLLTNSNSNLDDIIITIVCIVGFYYLSRMFSDLQEKLNVKTNEKSELIKTLYKRNNDMHLLSQIMSHDMKAPLNSIKGYNSIIKSIVKESNSSDLENAIELIDGNVSKMKLLIDDLLLLSKTKLEENENKFYSLDESVNQILKSLNYQIETQKIEVIKTELGKINSDQKKLNIILQNLISNAIKYQPKNASHKASISIDRSDSINKVYIKVKDNGIGIPEDFIEDLFEPFKRFDHEFVEGTGLGLAICNSLIDALGGKITVKSHINKGSTFTIELPKQSNQ